MSQDPSIVDHVRAPSTPGNTGNRHRPARLPSLTGLRFLAALAVFSYHVTLPIPALRVLRDDGAVGEGYKLFGQAGALGVSFFFVLSGFVLTWSAREGDRAGKFWRRRYVKIIPPYVVAWALALVLFAGAYTPAWRAAANLFMLQVWIPDFDTYFSVDPPSWSLAAEAIFYLAFPAMLLVVRRIRAERLLAWTGVVAVALIATPALGYWLLPDTPGIPGGEHASVSQYFVFYVLPIPRLLDFALGMLVARAVQAGRWRSTGIVPSALLLLVGYWLTAHVPYLYAQRGATTVIPIVLLIASVAIADTRGRSTVLRSRAMVFLGEISFAFYLLHFVVLATGRKLLGADRLLSTGAAVGFTLGMLVVAVLASWLLYAVLERPITQRWSTSRRRPATPADPVEQPAADPADAVVPPAPRSPAEPDPVSSKEGSR